MTGHRWQIDHVRTSVYRFPTEEPEADGTLQWDATTAVAVHVTAGGHTGLGWTYSTGAAAGLILDELKDVLIGRDPYDITGAWMAMRRTCRNLGGKGLVMQAISAVDIALWDLKAQLLERPLTDVLGQTRAQVSIYGSGGFTTLSDGQLADQVATWQAVGCTAMKIKIGQAWGADVTRDLTRIQQLRSLAGPDVELMVDANGGYSPGQARRVGHALDDLGVTWFEEPVSSDDTQGLATVRDSTVCDVTAGEYASDSYDAERLSTAVDCLQLDATRCGGYTGWLQGAAIAAAHNLQVSAHCAPALHASVAASIANLRHIEYFIDHTRLEPLLVNGIPGARDGALHLTNTEPGHGMTIADTAHRYLLW